MKIREIEEDLKSIVIKCPKCGNQACNILIGLEPFHSPPMLFECSCRAIIGVLLIPITKKFDHEEIFDEIGQCYETRILVGRFGEAKVKFRISKTKYEKVCQERS